MIASGKATPQSGGRLISFTKAHACGNDFLIVTEEAAAGHDWADLTRRLCARNTGVGADGIEFFAWTGHQSRAASACTMPTAPSPRSAATARAAWPHGWRMNAVCAQATIWRSKPMPDCAFATSKRDQGEGLHRRRDNRNGHSSVRATHRRAGRRRKDRGR